MYAVSETRRQDPTSLITPRSSDATLFSRFTLRVSDDRVVNARGQAGVGITEHAGGACTVRLDSNQQLFAHFGLTALCLSIAVNWNVVDCSSCLFMHLIIAAALRRKMNTTGIYLDYFEVCVQ